MNVFVEDGEVEKFSTECSLTHSSFIYCMTLNRAACNPKDAEEAAKKMVDEWHKAILENRIKEVMGDGDASEVKNCGTNS